MACLFHRVAIKRLQLQGGVTAAGYEAANYALTQEENHIHACAENQKIHGIKKQPHIHLAGESGHTEFQLYWCNMWPI